VSHLHDSGRVLTTDYDEQGTRVHARVYPSDVAALSPFVRTETADAVETTEAAAS
jgi:GTP-binding protein HflX